MSLKRKRSKIKWLVNIKSYWGVFIVIFFLKSNAFRHMLHFYTTSAFLEKIFHFHSRGSNNLMKFMIQCCSLRAISAVLVKNCVFHFIPITKSERHFSSNFHFCNMYGAEDVESNVDQFILFSILLSSYRSTKHITRFLLEKELCELWKYVNDSSWEIQSTLHISWNRWRSEIEYKAHLFIWWRWSVDTDILFFFVLSFLFLTIFNQKKRKKNTHRYHIMI